MAKKPPETNPFVETLEIRGIWKLGFEYRKGGEGLTVFAHSRMTDGDERCNVFTTGLLNWFTSLTTSAKDMFMYIATHLGYESDVIELVEETYCKRIRVSRATFYNAKSELTNRLIVPRISRKNTYWVNPSYLFKGNRIEKYPSRIVAMNENPLERVRKQNVTTMDDAFKLLPKAEL